MVADLKKIMADGDSWWRDRVCSIVEKTFTGIIYFIKVRVYTHRCVLSFQSLLGIVEGDTYRSLLDLIACIKKNCQLQSDGGFNTIRQWLLTTLSTIRFIRVPHVNKVFYVCVSFGCSQHVSVFFCSVVTFTSLLVSLGSNSELPRDFSCSLAN